jgi:hypothetical protein
MSAATFPLNFADLARWANWALANEAERSAKRQASTMEEIDAFYTAMVTRLDDIFGHLDQHSLDDLPPDSISLMLLTLSLAEVAPAVEQFRQPAVTDGYETRRFHPSRRGYTGPAAG